MNGTIFHSKRFALHDGPGLRTTLFFKGCSLACKGCHNPESQSREKEIFFRPDRCRVCGNCLSACEHDARTQAGDRIVLDRNRCLRCGSCLETCLSEATEAVGQTLSVEEALALIEQDRLFFDESGGGATFSGGEPLDQAEFLLALLAGCRERAIHTVVDTSGQAAVEVFERVAGEADLFLFDLKLIDAERHEQFTGRTNETILSNLRYLSEQNRDTILRLPLFPGINDDKENLEATARFILDLPRPFPVDLLPYHRIGQDKYARLDREAPLGDLPAAGPPDLLWARAILQGHGLEVTVEGEQDGHD